MKCPVGLSTALPLLQSPDDASIYRSLAANGNVVREFGVRADLLARFVLVSGAPAPAVVAMVTGYFLFKTRHYPAMLQAMRRIGMTLGDEIYGVERQVAKLPPPSAEVRQALLNYLINTDDLKRPKRAALVAAMPKSASTFFCSALAKLLDGPMSTPHNRNESEGVGFDVLDFLRSYHLGGVMHSHLDASDRVISMAKLLDLRPVVQVRNIFDALASYIDHLQNRYYGGSQFRRLDEDARRRAVILRIARHHVDMVATWSRAEAVVPVFWLDFEAVRSDLAGALTAVARHLGVSADPSVVRRIVAESDPKNDKNVRFNKGLPGRGKMFTPTERAWVRTLYEEYPDVDFRRIDPEYGASDRWGNQRELEALS